MPRFKDIPQLTRANYYVNISWRYLKEWFKTCGEYNMDPPYQRGYVWSQKQQIAYLEYIIRGGRSGKEIYWNCPGWMKDFKGPLELVDGKQRINAVFELLDNKIPVFGHLYQEYTDQLDDLVCGFIWHVHDLEDPKEIVKWYISMNTGGSIHTEKDLEPAYKVLRVIEEANKGNIK